MKEFNVGDRVVVDYLDDGDEEFFQEGDTGKIVEVDIGTCCVSFDNGGDDESWYVTKSQISLVEKDSASQFDPSIYTVYKENAPHMSEDERSTLAKLLEKVHNDCSFAEDIDFEDDDSLFYCFRWSNTDEGHGYWYGVTNNICEAVDKQYVSKATTTVVEPLCVGDVQPISAVDFLRKAAELQESRAKEYDQEGGERSAGKIAEAFNAITGHNLTENDVWMLLVVLKQVRFYNNPANRHRDSVEDLVSYTALFAESVFK